MIDKQKAKQLREQGMTFKDIAKELSCSDAYLRSIMKGVAKGVKYEEKSVVEDLQRISKELIEIARRVG